MRRSLVALPLAVLMLAIGCATPRNRGRLLVFAKAKDAVKLDAHDVTEGESSTVTNNIFEGLVAFDRESTTIVPALSDRWTISPDGLTYTFHIRPGVRFHDDTTLDADAVVFNFKRQMDPANPYRYTAHFSYWNDFFKAVKDVRLQGTDSVVFQLSESDATFLTNLALFPLSIMSPTAIKTHGPDIGMHPTGTGPFMYATWLRGEKIVLKANPNYWRGKIAFDKLIFKPVPDSSARLLQLENGEISGMDGVNPDDVARIEKNPDIQLLSQPGMNVGHLAMNNEKPPFNNLKVRQAMAYAINKEAMVKAFFAGGKLGTAAINPMPPTIWGFNHDLKPLAHDPAKAKQLLAEAGYPNGLDIVLWAMPVPRPYMPQPGRIAEAIQSDLREVGIRASIRTYDWGIYLEKLGKGEHEAALMGWIGDNGDPDNFLYTLLDSDNTNKPAASNYCFYRNAEVHQRLIAAKRTTDRAKRIKLYEEAQAIIQQDVPIIPLFHSTQMVAFRKGISGFHLNPTGMKRFWTVKLPEAAGSDTTAAAGGQ
jgi:peptide/nickel transport system substrate-binding protein